LDERFLVTPAVAIEKSSEQVVSMSREACKCLELSFELTESFNVKKAEEIKNGEILVDEYEDRLGSYLLKTSNEIILERENREITKLLRIIGDIERISDHAVNISESASEMNEKGVVFSEDAKTELKIMIDAVREIVYVSFECIKTNDCEKATLVEPLEQTIDHICNSIKDRHIQRLQKNLCTTEQGFILTDILTDLERVADHCSNIAGYIIVLSKHNSLEMHRYLKEYRKDNEDFNKKYHYFSQKYKLPPKR
jgi:phosphate:Na+ symporter